MAGNLTMHREAIVKRAGRPQWATMRPVRVLVIEDDERLADVLARGLADTGHEVAVRRTGPDGLDAALAGGVDAIVLDWMLPRRDGPAVCRDLRARGGPPPGAMPPPRPRRAR